MATIKHENNGTIAIIGFEARLWAAADALRNNMDAAEYKHVVLGLIFLKYISDAFEAKHSELEAQRAEGADPEDPGHGHVLTPGRYVDAEAAEDDGEPFAEKMRRLTATLRQQMEESARLDQAIRANLRGIGYGE